MRNIMASARIAAQHAWCGIVLVGLLAAWPVAAAPQSPEAAWKAGLADANLAYSQKPHAILKIQDAAYLGEGDAATLVGAKAKPDSFHWEAGVKAGALVARYAHGHASAAMNGKNFDEKAIEKGIRITPDIDIMGVPTQVDAGVMGVRIFIFNQQAKAAKEFKGLDYFPYDPSYRIAARFTPDPKLPPRVFVTSRKTSKQFYHAGDAVFALNGKKIRLPFYTDDTRPITDITAFFMDDMTGRGTYGAGRYVDADPFGKFPPKTITIDFNDAYNPNCARSAFFTCPVATDNIPVAIKAGERDPHMKH
jgi:uncharacterized protein (DUF1684 family)